MTGVSPWVLPTGAAGGLGTATEPEGRVLGVAGLRLPGRRWTELCRVECCPQVSFRGRCSGTPARGAAVSAEPSAPATTVGAEPGVRPCSRDKHCLPGQPGPHQVAATPGLRYILEEGLGLRDSRVPSAPRPGRSVGWNSSRHTKRWRVRLALGTCGTGATDQYFSLFPWLSL